MTVLIGSSAGFASRMGHGGIYSLRGYFFNFPASGFFTLLRAGICLNLRPQSGPVIWPFPCIKRSNDFVSRRKEMFCRVATHIVGAFVLAAVVSGPAPAAHAATIFSDNFNEDSTGAKTSTTNFTVTNLNGSIDVIANGDFGLPCVDGNCIDLDGATNVAAVFASKSITLSPGSYTLTFDLSGSQRGDTNKVNVSFAGIQLDSITSASYDPYKLIIETFSLAATTTGSITFDETVSPTAGDNKGQLLDDVILQSTDVLEPGSLALLGSGIMGLAFFHRRRARFPAANG